jgi:hypothetical protein
MFSSFLILTFIQVYETGCQGLVVSAVMDRLVGRGKSGPDGKLVHIFQTGTPQTQALAAMNFSEEVIAEHVRAKLTEKTFTGWFRRKYNFKYLCHFTHWFKCY